jgi:hypothetical protein
VDKRALIFSNLLNGVPDWQVARDFNVSVEEVKQIFSFVLRKVKSYCFLRQTQVAYPTIIAHTVDEARKFRLTCLAVLPKLNLDKEAQFKDIQTEVVTPDNVLTIARNLNT